MLNAILTSKADAKEKKYQKSEKSNIAAKKFELTKGFPKSEVCVSRILIFFFKIAPK